MTKTNTSGAGRSPRSTPPLAGDVALERALEGLFRLGANRRFDARQRAAVGAEVTRAGYAVLRSLADHGTLTLRQTAAASVMDSATASRQVMQLVEEGLVQRASADNDARSVELSLTSRGREIYERIVRYRLDHLAKVVADWSPKDRATLAELATRLAAGLATTVPDAGVTSSTRDP